MDGRAVLNEPITSDVAVLHTIEVHLDAGCTTSGPEQVFCELVKSWKKTIIVGFQIAESDFKVIHEDRLENGTRKAVCKVPRPRIDLPEYLGYICFDERAGSFEFVNRKADLKPSALESIFRSGSVNQHDAGGEGLKIELLAMQQHGQSRAIRCISRSFNWDFNLTAPGSLSLVNCLSARPTARLIRTNDRERDLPGRGLVPFTPLPSEDVQFIISGGSIGQCEDGIPVISSPVRFGDFTEGCKSALFLQNASRHGIISGSRGDLIVDPCLRGNLYFKGFLLKRIGSGSFASLTGKELMLGYNFYEGETNSAGQLFADAEQEGQAMMDIWEDVLAAKPENVAYLSNLLLSSIPEYADIAMAMRDRSLSFDSATLLRNHLVSNRSKWYYPDIEKAENINLHIIIKTLDRQGHKLAYPYWTILRNHRLMRTAQEEDQRRFLGAQPVTMLPSSFAQELDHLLRASIEYCEWGTRMAVEFVQAGELSTNICYVEGRELFKIHDKWLDQAPARAELGITSGCAEANLLFIVSEVDNSNGWIRWRKNRREMSAEANLLQYFQMRNDFSFGASDSGLAQVCWSGVNKDGVNIQIHRRETCLHIRQLLLSRDFVGVYFPYIDEGRCFHISSSGTLQRNALILNDLDHETEYFSVMFRPPIPRSIVIASDIYKTPSQAQLASNKRQRFRM